MRLMISLMVALCQWSSISCSPGIISDAQDFRKGISTKQPSLNSIADIIKSTTPPTSVNPIKITHEDVVLGNNAVYGSQQQLSNGGIIFAIRQSEGSTSTPLMSAAPPQPVLMQYLSAQGTPQQSAVQYIQLLRPVMMVPAQPYIASKPLNDPQIETDFLPSSPPTQPPTNSPSTRHSLMNPYGPYSRQSPHASYSSPLTSYNPRPAVNHRFSSFDMALNLNEYMPSASSQLSAVLAPRSSISTLISPYAPYASYKSNKFQPRAQRA